MQLMLKHQQRNDIFFISTLEQLCIVIVFFGFFLLCPDKPDIVACESLITVCMLCFAVVSEVKELPEAVLGKVATTLKEERHPHIMQY